MRECGGLQTDVHDERNPTLPMACWLSCAPVARAALLVAASHSEGSLEAVNARASCMPVFSVILACAQEFALAGDYIEQDDALIEVEVWVRGPCTTAIALVICSLHSP